MRQPKELGQGRLLRLAIAGLTVTAVISAVGWVGGALLAGFGPSLESATTTVSFLGPLGRVQDLLLLLFAAGVMRLFLLSLPVGALPGAAVWRHSKLMWVLLTAAVAFFFSHALVNQEGTAGYVLGDHLPIVLGLAFGSVVLGLLLVFLGRLRRLEPTA